VETSWKSSTSKNEKEMVGNSKIGVREIGCEDGRWMELAQDHVQ
jgi:hypothetical protein